MDHFTLTGGISWIASICMLFTTAAIFLFGSWVILNFFVWDILVQYSMRYLRLYSLFIHFIKYNKRYAKWVKRYGGKMEEGANDED